MPHFKFIFHLQAKTFDGEIAQELEYARALRVRGGRGGTAGSGGRGEIAERERLVSIERRAVNSSVSVGGGIDARRQHVDLLLQLGAVEVGRERLGVLRLVEVGRRLVRVAAAAAAVAANSRRLDHVELLDDVLVLLEEDGRRLGEKVGEVAHAHLGQVGILERQSAEHLHTAGDERRLGDRVRERHVDEELLRALGAQLLRVLLVLHAQEVELDGGRIGLYDQRVLRARPRHGRRCRDGLERSRIATAAVVVVVVVATAAHTGLESLQFGLEAAGVVVEEGARRRDARLFATAAVLAALQCVVATGRCHCGRGVRAVAAGSR